MLDSGEPKTADIRAEEEAESDKDRLEREHGELMEELRAMIPGAEVLFGFLLAICFSERFGTLTDAQLRIYYVTLLSTAAALVFLLSPSAYHRIRFRAGDKDRMMTKGNREAVAGSVAIAIAFTAVIHLVSDLLFGITVAIVVAAAFFVLIAWRWWALALYRAWHDRTHGPSGTA